MSPQELTGVAREVYEGWRRLGCSEADALDRTRRSGAIEEQALVESFQAMGLSEADARTAAQGRNGVLSPDPQDQMREAFRRIGLSESEARTAAAGRTRSRYQARGELFESDTDDDGIDLDSIGYRAALADAVRAAKTRHRIGEAQARIHLEALASRDRTDITDTRWLREYAEKHGGYYTSLRTLNGM